MNNEMNRVVKELKLEKAATERLPATSLGVALPSPDIYDGTKTEGV